MDYICYISRNKVDQLHALLEPNRISDVTEQITRENTRDTGFGGGLSIAKISDLFKAGITYGRKDVLQIERKVKVAYTEKLRDVLLAIAADHGDVPELSAVPAGGDSGVYYYYSGSFRVKPFTQPVDDGSIATITSKGAGFSLTLDCSLRYFSEYSGGHLFHSGNDMFFRGVISLHLSGVLILLDRQGTKIYASPLYLELSNIGANSHLALLYAAWEACLSLLDIENDDPEEYPGKQILIYDCLYEIGALLDVGMERLVYRVRNVESGLSLHVLKVQRAGLAGAPAVKLFYLGKYRSRELGLADLEGASEGRKDVFTDSMLVPSEVGLMELQPDAYMAIGAEPRDSATLPIVIEAGRMIEAGDMNGARGKFEEALEINPAHTIALYNLAIIQRDLGDKEAAFRFAIQACSIEPNLADYLRAVVNMAVGAEYFGVAVRFYKALQRKFPYENRVSVDAMIAYLGIGLPDMAAAVRHDDLPERAADELVSIDKLIEQHLAAKNSSMIPYAKARAAILARQADFQTGVERLREALSLYPQRLDAQINLALALAAQHQFDEAVAAFRSVLHHLAGENLAICEANYWYAQIGRGEFDQGEEFLRKWYARKIWEPGMDASIEDLPRAAIWYGWRDTWSQRDPVDFLKFLNQIVALHPDVEVPPLLAVTIQLLEDYKRHMLNIVEGFKDI